MKKTIRLFFALGISALLFSSCEKDPIIPSVNVKNGIIIGHEGQFLKNQASLSYIDLDNFTITNDVYAVKNGEIMGDICQSLNMINGKLYALINNSKKILVINPENFERLDSIFIDGYPQNIIDGGNGVAYVSDLFGKPISVINLSTNKVTGQIPCPGSTQEMIRVNNKVYVSNSSSEYLYMINSGSSSISDSLFIGKGAKTLALGKNNILWIGFGVVYDSNWNPIENGKIKLLNLSNSTVERSFTMSSGGVSRLKISSDKSHVYYLNGSVFKMGIDDSTLSSNPWFSKAGASLNSLGLDPKGEYVLVGDAKDYASAGMVYLLDQSGQTKKEFTSGVIPSDFAFIRN